MLDTIVFALDANANIFAHPALYLTKKNAHPPLHTRGVQLFWVCIAHHVHAHP